MRRTRQLVVLGLVVVVVVITVVAVTTSTKAPSSSTNADRTPAMSLADLRAQFVADETVASDASTQAGGTIDSLGSDPSASALAAAAAPIVTAGQKYLMQLRHLPWPANMISDAKALEAAVARYVELVQSARNANVSSQATWNDAALVLATVRQATNKLRHDFGLLPIASP